MYTHVLDEHEALGVRDDLGGVESLLEVGEELLLVTGEVWRWASKLAAGAGALSLEGGEATGEDGLADESHRLAHVESVDGGPLAGTLLASSVEDLLNQWGLGVVWVLVEEDVAGDLDKE